MTNFIKKHYNIMQKRGKWQQIVLKAVEAKKSPSSLPDIKKWIANNYNYNTSNPKNWPKLNKAKRELVEEKILIKVKGKFKISTKSPSPQKKNPKSATKTGDGKKKRKSPEKIHKFQNSNVRRRKRTRKRNRRFGKWRERDAKRKQSKSLFSQNDFDMGIWTCLECELENPNDKSVCDFCGEDYYVESSDDDYQPPPSDYGLKRSQDAFYEAQQEHWARERERQIRNAEMQERIEQEWAQGQVGRVARGFLGRLRARQLRNTRQKRPKSAMKNKKTRGGGANKRTHKFQNEIEWWNNPDIILPLSLSLLAGGYAALVWIDNKLAEREGREKKLMKERRKTARKELLKNTNIPQVIIDEITNRYLFSELDKKYSN